MSTQPQLPMGLPVGHQRLFFALCPDTPVRNALGEPVRRLSLQGKPPGRMVHPEDLHLTLVFLGEVAVERFPHLLAAAEAVRGVPFTLLIEKVGCWDRGGILWCGPHRTPPALAELVSDLQQKLAARGFPPERRPFRAHLTLARDARPLPDRELERPIPWSVQEFVLVRSQLGGKPPRYTVLKRWPLECQTQV